MNLEMIKNEIKTPLEEKGIAILDICFEIENYINYLRVTIDTISLDTVVEATKIINKILDEKDVSEDSYTLEVLSKGEEENE